MEKEKKTQVIRISSDVLIVGGIICRKTHGIYCAEFQRKLGTDRINAIFDYIKGEKDQLMIEATFAVQSLLIELNFKYKQN